MKYTYKSAFIAMCAILFLSVLTACGDANNSTNGLYVANNNIQAIEENDEGSGTVHQEVVPYIATEQAAESTEEIGAYDLEIEVEPPSSNYESTSEPEQTPESIPEPTTILEPTPTPPPTPEPTPSPTPTAEPIQTANTFIFPFQFSTVDLHGNYVTHESLGEKEAFFVYYWTTWCISCVQGMPDLARLAEEYAGRVGFISLLGDFGLARDTAIRITENSGVPFITVDATHGEFQLLMDMLDSGFVPTSVVIGRDGTAIGGQIVGSGVDRFQSAIENALEG